MEFQIVGNGPKATLRNYLLLLVEFGFICFCVYFLIQKVFSVCDLRVPLCYTVARHVANGGCSVFFPGKKTFEKDTRHFYKSEVEKKEAKIFLRTTNILSPSAILSFFFLCRWTVCCECDSSATKPEYLHLCFRQHLAGLPAFHNLSVCELYVLILFTEQRESRERHCSRHKTILY